MTRHRSAAAARPQPLLAVATLPPDADGALVLTMGVADPGLLITANHRDHWASTATRTAYWRLLTRVAAGSAVRTGKWPRLHRARITVVMSWTDRRHRDPNNWAPTGKALVDGLVDAHLLPDDDTTHVIGPDMRGVLGERLPMITMIIDPLQPGEDPTPR